MSSENWKSSEKSTLRQAKKAVKRRRQMKRKLPQLS